MISQPGVQLAHVRDGVHSPIAWRAPLALAHGHPRHCVKCALLRVPLRGVPAVSKYTSSRGAA
eukprot:2069735-Prymnesium_polylepis.1